MNIAGENSERKTTVFRLGDATVVITKDNYRDDNRNDLKAMKTLLLNLRGDGYYTLDVHAALLRVAKALGVDVGVQTAPTSDNEN